MRVETYRESKERMEKKMLSDHAYTFTHNRNPGA